MISFRAIVNPFRYLPFQTTIPGCLACCFESQVSDAIPQILVLDISYQHFRVLKCKSNTLNSKNSEMECAIHARSMRAHRPPYRPTVAHWPPSDRHTPHPAPHDQPLLWCGYSILTSQFTILPRGLVLKMCCIEFKVLEDYTQMKAVCNLLVVTMSFSGTRLKDRRTRGVTCWTFDQYVPVCANKG